jgi:hypothetical protein
LEKQARMGNRENIGFSCVMTRKVRKAQHDLIIQKAIVQKIEDFLINYVDPVECPVKHHFTDGICCREFFMTAGTLLTGTIYKIELLMVLAKGSLRIVEGNHTRDLTAPCLMKNSVGQKNSWFAFEDTLIYGFIPNPDNLHNIGDIINIFSAIDAREIQNMGNNKQQINYQKRLENGLN